ncbi:hypothetical protein [Actinacidiphila sp. ITFR-21]|uniref:hypothetical protein n=1 Tax=Actinacidiphila sp. ITFR-21 TaxID=3075199 RepID=UPI0028897D32|nr:hypothetical protein [Streptomyces sp. ITFR-21]WNI14067.1 hypothetical protein RLT57_00010 [Streptomyces sp. ITFR-21]
MHLADVRQDPRARLEELRAFVRQNPILQRTSPNTMGRRRDMVALGEADRLCSARSIKYATGDVIVCTREAGHYEGDGPRRARNRKAGTNATWPPPFDDRPYNDPHKTA